MIGLTLKKNFVGKSFNIAINIFENLASFMLSKFSKSKVLKVFGGFNQLNKNNALDNF